MKLKLGSDGRGDGNVQDGGLAPSGRRETRCETVSKRPYRAKSLGCHGDPHCSECGRVDVQ